MGFQVMIRHHTGWMCNLYNFPNEVQTFYYVFSPDTLRCSLHFSLKGSSFEKRCNLLLQKLRFQRFLFSISLINE